jgi:hypothetical protein
MGTMGFIIVKVRVRWATMSNNELKIIIVALLPCLSATHPKTGVNKTVKNMGMDVSFPDKAVVRLNLLCNKSVAYLRKGKNAA